MGLVRNKNHSLYFLLLVQLWNFDELQTMMTINLLTYATLFTGFIVYLFMIKPEIGNKILSSFKRNHLQRTLQGYIEYLIIYMALIIIINCYSNISIMEIHQTTTKVHWLIFPSIKLHLFL